MAPQPKSQTQKTGITVPPKWKGKIPAFLFRGWKPSCGGNPRLNTKSSVIPHAFYGSHGEPSDKSIVKIPEAQIKSEIAGHLTGSHVISHFSSWAADLQTALYFAGVGKDAHIAVFDTSLRGQHNEIYHVPALYEIGLSSHLYVEEYLVYGPVAGEAYTCVSVVRLRELGMKVSVASGGGKSEISEKHLRHAGKIANAFRPLCHTKGPDLFLTVFAAELGRLLRTAQGGNGGRGWSQEENRDILRFLSNIGDFAAKRPRKKSLVNPKTYVHSLPQLKAMIDILMTVELEIDRKRSEMSKNSSPTIDAALESGKKRKADEMQVPTDSEVTHKQNYSADDLYARAKLLRAKLITTKEKLDASTIVPEEGTVNNSKGCTEPAGSHLDRLAKWAKVFDAELHSAEASIASLHKSCDELIESINGAKDNFARPRPQKPHPASTPSITSPLVPKDPKELIWGMPGPMKRRKKRGMWSGVVIRVSSVAEDLM